MKLLNIFKATFVILLQLHLYAVSGNSTEISNNASTIMCFQCNSAEHAECADLTLNDTSSPFFKTCADFSGNGGLRLFCRKVQDTIKAVKHRDETRTVRSCGWILETNETRKDYCKKGDTDFILRTSCVCFSDGCNGSTKMSSSLGFFTLSAVAIFRALKNVLSIV